MNCKQIQELLPLYAGRDLEEKRARLIATHIQSCTECAGSAAEYEETRRLLQEFAPPTFIEATYAGIREQVWREIEQKESTAPSLPQLVAGLFRPRLSWAVASALLLVVSLFALYFIANRSTERREVAEVHAPGSPQRPEATASNSSLPEPRKDNAPLTRDKDRIKGADTAIDGSGDGKPPSQRRKHLGTVAGRQVVAVITPAQRSTVVESSPQANNPAESGASPQTPGGSEKMLRVEMQTKDPNIRIIWFSPQRNKQDSPGKFSKGV